jgi:uncharacterized membrane protein
MTRYEFIEQLAYHLRGLPLAERDAALTYYAEYIIDAGEENEAYTIAELGSPADVASQIIGYYAVKPPERAKRSAKKSLSKAWIVLIAIFGIPVGLPLAISFAAVALSLFIALCAVLFAFAVASISLIASGLVYLVASMSFIFEDVAMVAYIFGGGLLIGGLGLAFIQGTLSLTRVSFDGIAKLFGKLILRRSTVHS